MPTHQFLVASYRKDFPWLRTNLRSLQKFSRGFLPPAVVVPPEDEALARAVVGQVGYGEVQVKAGPGFGRAQVVMLSGDIHCPGADYVYLTGSDCMAVREFDFSEYWLNGKPLMLFNTWSHLVKHGAPCMSWKAGTEHALGGTSQGEFMRRLPIVYPRALYAACRAAVQARHGDFERYVLHSVNHVRNFSESNVLGEYAFRHMRDVYTWHCLDTAHYLGAFAMTQFWSWGGLGRPSPLHGNKTPQQVIIELLGSL